MILFPGLVGRAVLTQDQPRCSSNTRLCTKIAQLDQLVEAAGKRYRAKSGGEVSGKSEGGLCGSLPYRPPSSSPARHVVGVRWSR